MTTQNQATSSAKRHAKRVHTTPVITNFKLQAEYQRWLNDFDFPNAQAVTLTLNLGVTVNGYHIAGDRDKYAKNLRFFLNRLNWEIFGSGMAHKGWRFSVASFFEKSADGRPHYHLIISKPDHVSDAYFTWLINHIWSRTTWGRRINHVVRVRDTGWIGYITKFKTKKKFGDALEESCTYQCDDPPVVPFRIRFRKKTEFYAELFKRSEQELRRYRLGNLLGCTEAELDDMGY